MAALHVLRGPHEGKIIPLNVDRFCIGRNPDCDLPIPRSTSREHAQIVRVAGKFFIEDNKTRNGTFVNTRAIASRTELRNDDRVRICDFIAAFLDTACLSDLSRQVVLDQRWRTPTVLSLALASYEERPLPLSHLDPARLAVLSDALEEAGCTERAILEHLRSPGPHVRACWALGLILGEG
jgi:pSer/pThr/pTyr-binding forkhead associated (FHA) protein